jgi:cystathionine beta-lyase/cystathionine gamma-synthase
MKPPTRVNHPPEVRVPEDNRPLVAPIYQSVKFTMDSVAEAEKYNRGERDGFVYSRVSNPTLRQLELTLAELQGRDACLLTASGVAAVNLALLSLCKQGDHVIVFAEMYQPTRYMVRRLLARYGVQHTMLSIEDTDRLESTLEQKPTRLLVFESPSNPLLKIADIQRITTAARKCGALTVLDNTFAGFHNHGQLDIDIFVHSLTKYASGHGDVMGGAVIASSELIAAMQRDFVIMGATLDPHAAFLIQRGMKTYFLRYQQQASSARTIAEWLSQQRTVARVHFPGLSSHPRHAIAARQMQDFGSIITMDLADNADPVRFCEALKYFAISASLGSTESLVQPGQLMRPADLNEEERQWASVSNRTIRLSIGVEEVSDLLGDLQQALAVAADSG